MGSAVRKLLAFVLIALVPLPSGAAIAHVQSNANGTAIGTSPCTVAYPGNVTAGNLLVGYCYSANVGATVVATDTLGQTWSEAQSQSQATDGHVMKILYFPNTAGGANTLSCTWTGGGATFRCGVSEYSGVATSLPLDQHTSAQGDAGTAANSGNVTPTQANELVIMAASDSAAGTFTIGTGTKRVNVPDATNTRIGGGEEIQTTATTRQSAWTVPSSNWTSEIATFKAAGAVAAGAGFDKRGKLMKLGVF